MKKIAIVTDSTSGYKNHQFPDFYVVPMIINVQNKNDKNKTITSYHEGIDCDYTKMKSIMLDKTNEISTSQPNIGEINELFQKISTEYDEVYVLPITANVSGSENAWKLVATDYQNIYVMHIHMGAPMLKFYIQDFIKARKSETLNKTWADNYCKNATKSIYVVFIGTNSPFVAKNSRIKGLFLKALSSFRIKLLCSVDTQGVKYLTIARNYKKAHKSALKYFSECIDKPIQPEDIARIMFIHDPTDEYANDINECITLFRQSLVKDAEVWDEIMSPSILFYTGLNELLVAIQLKEPLIKDLSKK